MLGFYGIKIGASWWERSIGPRLIKTMLYHWAKEALFGTRWWLRSIYSCLIKTVPHHSVYRVLNNFGAPWQNRTAVSALQRRCNTIIRIELIKQDTFLTNALPSELIWHEAKCWNRTNDTSFDVFCCMYPKTGAAGRIRTSITSLEWNFYVAVSTLVRVDLFKRPSH